MATNEETFMNLKYPRNISVFNLGANTKNVSEVLVISETFMFRKVYPFARRGNNLNI